MTESFQRILKLAWLDIRERGWYWLVFGVVFAVAAGLLMQLLGVTLLKYDWCDSAQSIWDAAMRFGYLGGVTIIFAMNASAFSSVWRDGEAAQSLLLPVRASEKIGALILSRYVFGIAVGIITSMTFISILAGKLLFSLYVFAFFSVYILPIAAAYFFGSIQWRRFGSVWISIIWILFLIGSYQLSMLAIAADFQREYMIPNFASSYDAMLLAEQVSVYGIPGGIYTLVMKSWFHVVLPAALIYLAYRKLRATER